MPDFVIISSYFGVDNVDEAEKVWEQFDPSIRYCYALKQLEDLIQRGKSCAVGHEAPDFELMTPAGEKIKLSSCQSEDRDVWAMQFYPFQIGEREYKLSELATVEKGQMPQEVAKENQQYRLGGWCFN